MSLLHLVCVLSATVGAEPTAPHEVTVPGHRFTLPTGFEIEAVAAPPLVERPIHVDFDEAGRLYVAESSGTNDKVEKQLADEPHSILRLEDTDDDGTFDRRTIFADKLMLPEGVLCYDGSVYVAAPPSIWKFTDTDDDGIADRREEWFAGKTLTGCANDLHGPFAGPDGWIYWCKGAFAQQTYERPGKPPFVTRAAHIFRCRPDGTGIEPVMTGGMDNPVEVTFTPGGERIFTTTFLQHPGGGQRDGLIHAIYGGVYGKVHSVLDDHPRTGDIMPVLAHLGPAAPAGLACYESRGFGDEFEGNLFAALFNLHKVTRHVLTPQGGTFVSRDEDFVISDNLDFHPTDVLEDADGSLLIVNTGGWYKLCCPTSQLWKPDVLGGIYRVRRTGVPRVSDPRGLKIDWSRQTPAQLAKRLADPRPAVARRAMQRLGQLGKEALSPLQAGLKAASDTERRRAVWTLSRIDAPEARELIRQALSDSDSNVRQAALHVVSLWHDAAAAPECIKLLNSRDDANRRAAAEALGRIGDATAVAPLLAVAEGELDRTLEHSLVYALIELAQAEPTAAGLVSNNPRTRRAALLALDQMPGGKLEPAAVAAHLQSPDAALRATAAWIVMRHANWGQTLAPNFARQLAADELPEEDASLLTQLLARFAHDSEIQALLAARLESRETSLFMRRLILQAMARGGLKVVPSAWITPLAHALASDDLAAQAAAAVRAIPGVVEGLGELRSALLSTAGNDRLPPIVRLEALGVLPGGMTTIEPATFEFIRGNLSPEAQVSLRLAAAEVLSKAPLDDRQLLALTEIVRAAGPLEIERLVTPFTRGNRDDVGEALVVALADSAALTNLRAETLQTVFKPYGAKVQEASQRLHQLLAKAAEERKAKIEELLTLVPQGDIRRGQLVFNNQKAACATCHAIGYLGGNVGPDLTKIGGIRSERDLLEAIVFPSASFVRSYEPVVVTTRSGQTFSGTLKKDAPDEVILAVNAKDTARIAREDIEEMVPGTVSIMPAGLDQQVTPQELADLIVFLRSAK